MSQNNEQFVGTPSKIPIHDLMVTALKQHGIPSLFPNTQCFETITTTVNKDSLQFQTSRYSVNGPTERPKIELIETNPPIVDNDQYLVIGNIIPEELKKLGKIVHHNDLISLHQSSPSKFNGIFLCNPGTIEQLALYRKENLMFLRKYLKIGGCLLIPDCVLDDGNFRFVDSTVSFEDCINRELSLHRMKSKNYHRDIITKSDIGLTLPNTYNTDEGQMIAFLSIFLTEIRKENIKAITECGFEVKWVSTKETADQKDQQYPPIFLSGSHMYGFYHCTRI